MDDFTLNPLSAGDAFKRIHTVFPQLKFDRNWKNIPLFFEKICMYKSWVKPPLWNLAGLIFKWGGIFLSFEVGNCVSNANFKWKENVK